MNYELWYEQEIIFFKARWVVRGGTDRQTVACFPGGTCTVGLCHDGTKKLPELPDHGKPKTVIENHAAAVPFG